MKPTAQANTSRKRKPASRDEILVLGGRVFDFLDSQKTADLLLLDLTDVNPYFRSFLIGTATSQVHLKALVREVLREFAAELPKSGPATRTDDAESGWVIIDFIDVVVHLFVKELRDFYNLERLWGDGRVIRTGSTPTARPE